MHATVILPLSERAQRFGRAWIGLALVLGLHVADEAANDFLSVYNPMVQSLRAVLPWLPLPTFSFRVWLGGLAAGIALLLVLARSAFRARNWLVTVAIPFSALMIANALGHLVGSIVLGRWLPGVYSAPALLAIALFTLVEAIRLRAALRAPR